MSHPYIIQTHQLDFSFDRRQILYSVDLQVPEGSIFGFLGPNGAGKTTTIKALLGLLRVPEGNIFLFGKDIRKERIAILGKTGNMVEGPSLYDHLSGFQNLMLNCRLCHHPLERIPEVLHIVDMEKDAKRPVKQYSTGMKQRLSLAIALLSKPELLILDEPINGLDPAGIIEIRNLLKSLNQTRNCTVFLSSHILGEIEKLCTDIAIIHQGRLRFQGKMTDFLHQKSGTTQLRVEVDRPDWVFSLFPEALKADHNDNCLLFNVKDKTDSARILRKLMENGIEIYRAEPMENDLEESFLELIQS